MHTEETNTTTKFEWIHSKPLEKTPTVDWFTEEDAADDGHTNNFSWITLKEDEEAFDDYELSMSMDKAIDVDYSWIEEVDEPEVDLNEISWIRAVGKSSKSSYSGKSTKSPTYSGKSSKNSSSPALYSGKSSKSSSYSGKSSKSVVNFQTEVNGQFTNDLHTDDGHTDFSWVTEDDLASLVDIEVSLSMIAAVEISLPMSLSMENDKDYADTDFTWIELV